VRKKKKRKRKKKMMEENMMKWPYSSRSSTSYKKREDLTTEIEEKSQGQRECATIAARMGISLPNTHMRGKRKTMRRKRSLTKAIKKKRKFTKKKPYGQAHVGQE
jgi:hypothetical protein